MLDFIKIKNTSSKKGELIVYPEFLINKRSKDLMTRGKAFYAVWDEAAGLWSRDEATVQRLVDDCVRQEAEKIKTECLVKPQFLENFSSGRWTQWQTYVKSLPENFHELDENITFANTKVKRKDYVSRRLSYAMEEGEFEAYETLISTLYDPEEREKIEWAIGAVISGDSKHIQKFLVLYGAAGSGKSTILNIIQMLFDGYFSVFEAKALASANNSFALESFKSNPLVSIQHDGDLSKIEDNTKLNSIVSHEYMVVNEKFKSTYAMRFNTFLFMGTNKPVKITDAKSGIIRRLIDVHPSGRKVSYKKYMALMNRITFELGAIADHCLKVYLNLGENYYDTYRPLSMLGATNDFYNFMEEYYEYFASRDGVTLKDAWVKYDDYCKEAKVNYPYSKRLFKEELKNYFKEFESRRQLEGGLRVWNYYSSFITSKFDYEPLEKPREEAYSLTFNCTESRFDEEYANCPAQPSSNGVSPDKAWDNCTTTLADICTTDLHYVRVPENHIVIDFDIKDLDGNKSYEKNLEAASKWPPTYAELSKSGAGIHLHYLYEGPVSEISRIYDKDIEIKVFTGKSSLRRKLTRCNNIPVATLPVGSLPLKEVKESVNGAVIKSERGLRRLIVRNLLKEIHDSTKPSIDFIFKILEDAYNNGLHYDVTDMRPDILSFALGSTNNADYCVKLVNKMKFKSEEPHPTAEEKETPSLVFYDVEVFPNLFIIVWKREGEGNQPVIMINPDPLEVEALTAFNLVGFNCRRYDNHILWARMMGYTNEDLFKQSQRIINGSKNAFFSEAYNLSYADIYDFSSKKQSLKKFEIELGIHHQELGMKWDEPVPESRWEAVAGYCVNDVIATEAVFNARKQDFIAREILASLSGLTVNDTTRMHTTKIIFGNERNPKLVYTDLSEMFPGYTFEAGHSQYRDEDPGEGGYVYAEPGMYTNVALLDIASMHPTSIILLNLFGEYTKNFEEILQSRLLIKHHEFNKAKKLLNGALAEYLTSEEQADDLAYALKIVINSVYGFTTARFDNPFKDPRNIDNIVAKRGALFMINLKHEVQDRGFTVAHIKTDSIKIPNATPEIIKFVMEYGKQYGYNFEHEATYEKMCLVNDAVYIAKYAGQEECEKLYNYIPSDIRKHPKEWTATGAQFQVPYVFKTLFSKEPIVFEDMCETKSVSTALYLDCIEGLPEGEHHYRFIGKVGRFCPMLPGCGAGLLMREKDGKYNAATGSKGFLWMESEDVKVLGLEKYIDISYYQALVDDAMAKISSYGDVEMFRE